MNNVLATVGKIAGLGGIALGVFLLLFREVIRKQIFPQLTKDHAYSLIRHFMYLTFSVAALGLLPSVITSRSTSPPSSSSQLIQDNTIAVLQVTLTYQKLFEENQRLQTELAAAKATAQQAEVSRLKDLLEQAAIRLRNTNVDVRRATAASPIDFRVVPASVRAIGQCSPNITAVSGDVTIICPGLPPSEAQQLRENVRKMADNLAAQTPAVREWLKNSTIVRDSLQEGGDGILSPHNPRRSPPGPMK